MFFFISARVINNIKLFNSFETFETSENFFEYRILFEMIRIYVCVIYLYNVSIYKEEEKFSLNNIILLILHILFSLVNINLFIISKLFKAMM